MNEKHESVLLLSPFADDRFFEAWWVKSELAKHFENEGDQIALELNKMASRNAWAAAINFAELYLSGNLEPADLDYGSSKR
jgi:hypothetical protein